MKITTIREEIIKGVKLINFDRFLDNRGFFTETFRTSDFIENELKEWCIYMCVINDEKCIIEKSNIYFYTVLKILDNNFIQKFYVDKDESIIKEKYNIVTNNMDLIDKLFNLVNGKTSQGVQTVYKEIIIAKGTKFTQKMLQNIDYQNVNPTNWTTDKDKNKQIKQLLHNSKEHLRLVIIHL